MEAARREDHLLEELALIYLTLAHGTDEELDDAEVDAIASELHGWQSEARSESVLGAIKSALALYGRDDALDRVNEAIRNVRENVSEERRQLILDDLVEIAMADGQYLHEESVFIGELAEAWDVDVTDRESQNWAGNAWTVLQAEDPGESWTPVHDLALIYLTLAYRTDDELSAEEVDAITEKISEWIPGGTETDVLTVVRRVMNAYVQGPKQRVFSESVAAVGETVPQHQHQALLDDLRYVAAADGVVLDAEERMIRRLADRWGIALDEEEVIDEADVDGSNIDKGGGAGS